MNDGAVTRCGRGTGLKSAPDITLCSPELFEGLECKVVRCMGSEHFAMLVTSQSRALGTERGKGELV
jgi:hypothetical protein